jgi:hypothetical protein
MKLGLVAWTGIWRFVLRAIVLGIGSCAIFATSAEAVAHPILVRTHNRTAHTVLGFPEVKLFKVAERPKQGFADSFRFAVNEQHAFHYGNAKLVVKRLSDDVRGVLFPPVFKSFDLYIEHC